MYSLVSVVFILQFGVSLSATGLREASHGFGEDVTLSCFQPLDPGATVHWRYHSDKNTEPADVVKDGKVSERSARTARLRVKGDGTLVIKNVTAEDAGVYHCQFEGDIHVLRITLNILPGVTSSKDTASVGSTPESVTPTSKGGDLVNLDVDVFQLWSPLSIIMLTFCITALVLIVVLTIEIIRNQGCEKPLRDFTVRFVADDVTANRENTEDAAATVA